jgi:hypothetical protein
LASSKFAIQSKGNNMLTKKEFIAIAMKVIDEKVLDNANVVLVTLSNGDLCFFAVTDKEADKITANIKLNVYPEGRYVHIVEAEDNVGTYILGFGNEVKDANPQKILRAIPIEGETDVEMIKRISLSALEFIDNKTIPESMPLH